MDYPYEYFYSYGNVNLEAGDKEGFNVYSQAIEQFFTAQFLLTTLNFRSQCFLNSLNLTRTFTRTLTLHLTLLFDNGS